MNGGSATGGIPGSPNESAGRRTLPDATTSVGVGCALAVVVVVIILAIVLSGVASELSDVSNSYEEGSDGGLGSLGEIVGGLGWGLIVVAVIAVIAVVVAVRLQSKSDPLSHVKAAQQRRAAGTGEGEVVGATPVDTSAASAPSVPTVPTAPDAAPAGEPTSPPSVTTTSRGWTVTTFAVVAIHAVQGLLYLAISFQKRVDIDAPWGVFYVFTKVGLLGGGNDPRPHAQILGLLLIGSAWWYTKQDNRSRIAAIAVQSVVLAGCLRIIYLSAGGGGEEYRDGYDWQLSSILFTVMSAAAFYFAIVGGKRSRD